MNATYSPEDNKIRIYPDHRLDSEEYARVKAAGFKWAPKQGLFVAPMWTPSREDLAIELCGEIGDEDTSLVERAEERADRFETYSDNRERDAMRAKEAVSAIADNIPFGQPILVGHHSERHARRDAAKIENGMRKAVKMWEQSEYWSNRAAGAIRAAKYKERPDVRARRIKGLEADKRKQERNKKEAETFLKLWESIQGNSILKSKDGSEGTAKGRALHIANRDHIYRCFPLADYPRELPASQYEGDMSLWSALTDGIITAEQAQEIAIPIHQRRIKYADRWLLHIENRLMYEKAMLDEQGASSLIEPKKRPAQLPLCNYRAPGGINTENIYNRHEIINYPQIEMTKSEYTKIHGDWRGTRIVENSHRVRIAMIEYKSYCVFLTDSKEHKKPEPIKKQEKIVEIAPVISTYQPKERTEFDDMKDTLKAGVQVVSAPQLFPTPPKIAEKMVELAEVEPGLCVLEPSAGTGNLIKAVLDKVDTEVLAYEINNSLCSELSKKFPGYKAQVRCRDFLEVTDFMGEYPRIIMNPPFENGVDIKHINHARKFLAPGGRLVALCANGPRQQAAFKDIADYWEDLPAGSFKNQGTGVNVALMVLTV